MSQVKLLKTTHSKVNISKLNLKLKRQEKSICRLQSTIIELRKMIINKNKKTVHSDEKGIQCNTLKEEIHQQKCNADYLQSQIEETAYSNEDENKNLKIRSESQGRHILKS
ncbi:hypothetical protein SNE40_010857 [Patella caerulea]|uniref:Uncharacterized protein n=1 Tax=Patella caerulea TaxID=87958 RepID=A0AAN8PT88_PATCE